MKLKEIIIQNYFFLSILILLISLSIINVFVPDTLKTLIFLFQISITIGSIILILLGTLILNYKNKDSPECNLYNL